MPEGPIIRHMSLYYGKWFGAEASPFLSGGWKQKGRTIEARKRISLKIVGSPFPVNPTPFDRLNVRDLIYPPSLRPEIAVCIALEAME
jgi:hypothetical protein